MMSQALYRLGHVSARRPWVVIASWVILAIAVIGMSNTFGHALEDSFRVPGLDSQRANDLIAAAGTGQDGLTAQIVMTPLDPGATFVDSQVAQTALANLRVGADALPHVLSTASPDISPDSRVALITLQYPTLDQLSSADLENLKSYVTQASVDSPLQIETRGDLFFAFEQSAAGLGEAIGLLAALIILFLTFRSPIATVLPIGLAVFGLAVGLSLLPLLANVVVVPNWVLVLGAMVGLGVGIDYALFILTRHRESLAAGTSVPDSVAHALATAGQPVVFAGGIVVVSVLGLAVAGVPFMTGGGVALALVVAVMVLVSITLLPAFLGLAGHAVNRFGWGHRANTSRHAGWTRWIEHVTRNAWTYLIGVTVLLLAVAAPVLALRPGIPDDGALPTSHTERRAYDLVADGFGPGANGPLVIAVESTAGSNALTALADAVSADPGVASVGTPTVVSGIATVVVNATTGPQDEATADTVERLRAEVIPAALTDGSAQAYIGGQMVHFAAVGVRVNDRLPYFIAAVLALAFLLLMFVFRSVLVPLKAVVLNLLSIGAAYGVMVMVFQWGWGADLIGLTSTVPIVSFIPMFMFAILFGLSMDYEVFLLSRVREEYLETGDNDASVVRGIASTGRVITSAALIMIAVFLAFVTGEDAATKMFGLGLATAIFVDATLVRMVLVPAAMKLLGDANWWLPTWLDRLLPTVGGQLPRTIQTLRIGSDTSQSVSAPSGRIPTTPGRNSIESPS